MTITDIRIRRVQNEGRMKAVVSVTFNGEIVVHDIKIIEGNSRLFLAMPSRKMPDGSYRDIVHPIQLTVRQEIEAEILARYAAFSTEQDAESWVEAPSEAMAVT